MNERMIECRTCLGSGEILVGWTDGTWMNPPDPLTGECPICEGEGELDETELEEVWEGRWPSEDEAAEMYNDRLWDEYDE